MHPTLGPDFHHTCRRDVAGQSIDRLGAPRALAGSLLARAVILALLPAAVDANAAVLAVALFAWGVGQNVFFTASTTLVSQTPPARRGRALALNQAALSGGVMVGTACMGWAFTRFGFGWVAGISAGVTALAALVALARQRTSGQLR